MVANDHVKFPIRREATFLIFTSEISNLYGHDTEAPLNQRHLGHCDTWTFKETF
jgi:hypothetical protein